MTIGLEEALGQSGQSAAELFREIMVVERNENSVVEPAVVEQAAMGCLRTIAPNRDWTSQDAAFALLTFERLTRFLADEGWDTASDRLAIVAAWAVWYRARVRA